MRKRLKFTCWNCSRTFRVTLDISGQPRFLTECPYCHAACSVDLNPYRHSVTELLKGTETDLAKEELHLPDAIPTSEPEQEPKQEPES